MDSKIDKMFSHGSSINSILNRRWLSVDVIIVLRVLKLQNVNKRITQACCFITISVICVKLTASYCYLHGLIL